MRITLSTNGILLRKKADAILPYIDDLGIPIDGPSDEINKMMRLGKFKHFDIALDTVKYVQTAYPKIDLTIRTVVAQPNLEFVPQIGITLLRAGVDVEKLRWKLYQVNPIGPRKEDILSGDWLVSLENFNEIIGQCIAVNPKIKICAQPFEKHAGRYFMVFPDGASHTIENGADGFPCETNMGNVFEDLAMVINNLKGTEYLQNNDIHGAQL
jgi:MoaA/NifB/PqqE/SkfB family radical SAM enzyme